MKNNYEKIISGVEIILPKESFESEVRKFKENNEPMKVKLGFDPTAPDLHLGHFVVLKKLREFQELGHEIHIIIGSFTAMIGDPTGKNKTRPPLTLEEVRKNSDTHLQQLKRVLNIQKTKVHFNNTWFNTFKGDEIYELFSKYTINKLLKREDFSKRIDNGIDIYSHELIYPILQGYDSVHIESDIEIGGTDQLFNMQVGRHLQEAMGKKAQHVLCMPLLRGVDGEKKMSKSLGNYIGIMESDEEIKRKLLALPDGLVEEYIRLITNFSEAKKQEMISSIQGNEERYKEIIFTNLMQQLS